MKGWKTWSESGREVERVKTDVFLLPLSAVIRLM